MCLMSQKTSKSLVMLLCSFSLLLSSCDKGVPEINSGEPVTIFFSVNGDSFGVAEEITRSSETVEPETVVIPVEGGWYMYATLEPDASATRATSGGTDPLANNTEVRILAYLNGGTSITAQADYVVSGSALNPKTTDLSVPAGSSYTFVAYAVNGTTLPGTLTNINPNTTDVRWGETSLISVTSSTTVNIPISRLYSKVNAVVTNDQSHVIATTITGTVAGNLINLSTGKPAAGTATNPTLGTGWTRTMSNTVATSTANCYVYTAGAATTNMTLTGINLNSTAIANQTITFNKALAPNIPYALTVNFVRTVIEGPLTSFTYVGAFWRDNEIGERLIKIAGTGPTLLPWTATVTFLDGRWTAGTDGVVLAVGASPNKSDPNAENYPVGGGLTTISGTANSSNPIEFRIGLQQPYSSNESYRARYAVVEIAYNFKIQKIFLRQGHGDDYLYRKSEPINSADYTNTSRPLAVRFSPYNLTAPTLTVTAPGSLVSHFPQLAVRGGVFVDYPTKCGAFFMHGNVAASNQRRAFNTTAGSVTNWPSQADVTTTAWNAPVNGAGAFNETCPSAPYTYRRPSSGDDTTIGSSAWALSETFHSFSAINNTSTSGTPARSEAPLYVGSYADGLYDRNAVLPSDAHFILPDGTTYTRGLVIASELTNASLFLPLCGRLQPAGTNGVSWAASTSVVVYNTTWITSSGTGGAFYASLVYDGSGVYALPSVLNVVGGYTSQQAWPVRCCRD